MKNSVHYMSMLTGEITFSKKEAMELYRAAMTSLFGGGLKLYRK